MQITLWCILVSYQQTKDRWFKLVLETGELGAEQILWISEIYNKNAWATIGENPVNYDEIQDDLKKAIAEPIRKETPSQRLRAVFYLYGKQLWEKDANAFYEKQMEKLIEHFKSKLD